MGLLAIAIAPGLAICLFIFHRDAFNREPKLNLILSFILGAVSIIPAIFIETYFNYTFDNSIAGTAGTAFLVVALTEEFCKFAILRLHAYPRKSFDEPLDGIVFAVMIGMGFATAENIMYSFKYGMGTAVARMFLSVPAHATFGVLMGYYMGKAKFNPQSRTWLMFLGLFWAVFFHGAYDFFLFLQQSPEIKDYISNGGLFLGALISFIIALRLSWLQIKKHRRLSQRTYAPTLSLNLRAALEKDIPLIRDLTYKVWPQTYSAILTKDQIDYMLNMMYSETSLLEQMRRDKHEFIIVSDEKDPVGFASFSQSEPGVYKLHKIYILPSQQGRGTGKFVIEQVAKAILRKGGKILQLNVNRNNKAKDFYEKLGFTVISEEDIDIGGGYFMNDYVMQKVL